MTEETSESKIRAQQESTSNENLQRIGAALRRRREARGLGQRDVAERLHLPGMVVNDIETGQIGKLSGIYRRGYIRNYATLLELDPDELLAEAGEEVPPDLQEVLPVPHREWRLERYLKVATYLIVTVAIVPPLVYFFIAGGSRMIERDPAVADAPPAVESEVRPDNDRVAGMGDAGAEAAESRPDRHVSASAFPVTPLKSLREARPEPSAPAQGDVESEDGTGEGEGVDPAEPALTALQMDLVEDSWIEIRDARGERLEYDLLRAGQTRQYEGEAPFRVLLGRSSAVDLQVDGRRVVWDGHERGDLAEIEVAADGAVER